MADTMIRCTEPQWDAVDTKAMSHDTTLQSSPQSHCGLKLNIELGVKLELRELLFLETLVLDTMLTSPECAAHHQLDDGDADADKEHRFSTPRQPMLCAGDRQCVVLCEPSIRSRCVSSLTDPWN